MTPKELTEKYKQNPTLENYLNLRTAHPNTEIEIGIHGGIDPLFHIEPELQKFGIDPGMVAGAMDANTDDISQLSLQLIGTLVSRERFAKSGETHLGRGNRELIPEQLIDWLIACFLDSLSWNNETRIPRDLIVLIRYRLLGERPAIYAGFEKYLGKKRALEIAAQCIARRETVSIRSIAKFLLIEPSTISRWFPDGDFIDQAKKLAFLYDESPLPKPAGSDPDQGTST